MKEIKEDSNYPTWHDIQQMYTDAFVEVRESANRENTLASETIAELQTQCSKKDGIIWHTVTVALLSVLAAILMMNICREKSETQWRNTVEQINQDWIDYISQYDFVTQDGEGYNYYNSEVGGNVINGATNQKTEE